MLERLKKSCQVSKDLELCAELGVKQTTLSSWRARQTLDYRLLLEFSHSRGFELNYLFFGVENGKDKTSEDLLSLITNMVADKLKPDLNKQKELQEKLLYLLEKADIRRQLDEAREETVDERKNSKSH